MNFVGKFAICRNFFVLCVELIKYVGIVVPVNLAHTLAQETVISYNYKKQKQDERPSSSRTDFPRH